MTASGGWIQTVEVTGPLSAEQGRVEARLGWLTLATAMTRTPKLLADATERVLQLVLAVRGDSDAATTPARP